jgi:hypothetical protein
MIAANMRKGRLGNPTITPFVTYVGYITGVIWASPDDGCSTAGSNLGQMTFVVIGHLKENPRLSRGGSPARSSALQQVTARTKVAGSDFGPDWNGQRCGAHARTTGQPCRSPAVIGSRRCRMHGGAKGSGAPPGERNGAYRHGRFTGGGGPEGNRRGFAGRRQVPDRPRERQYSAGAAFAHRGGAGQFLTAVMTPGFSLPATRHFKIFQNFQTVALLA